MTQELTNYLLKRVAIILVFFTITPITLFASVISLRTISLSSTNKAKLETQHSEAKVFAPSKSKDSFPGLRVEVVSDDARSIIIENYLERQNSPLTPHANLLVEISDKYGLDYRLLPAIAQKESGLCRVIPEGSHNCWGWGIHSKGTLKFDNYPEAIETVAKGIRENYIDKGYVTPEQIMKKYAHPDSTTWAEGVSFYMQELE